MTDVLQLKIMAALLAAALAILGYERYAHEEAVAQKTEHQKNMELIRKQVAATPPGLQPGSLTVRKDRP